MDRITRTLGLTLFAVALLALAAPAPSHAAARIYVLVGDSPGEGFNDPTPVAPVGGNPGTTLGQQRLIAFQHAADIWGRTIDSNVDIYIGAFFNPLPANVLGRAGTWDLFSDFAGSGVFPGAEYPQTWYGSALADKRAGRDLDETAPDIFAQFSSDFDFYLGLDNNHGLKNDLVAVLLHEFAHGLGFQNFVNEETGSNFGDPTDPERYPFQTDVYSWFTLDKKTGRQWNLMTDAERAASAIRFGGVLWTGDKVTAGVPLVLSLGSPFLSIDAPAVVAGFYAFGTAGPGFGPPIGTPPVSGPVVYVNDGVGVGGDACTALPAGSAAGKIALIDRGACTFVVKVKNAQNAGAIGAIIANNAAGGGAFGIGGADPTITITPVSVSTADGAAIKAQLGVGVAASFGVDPTTRAGADGSGLARLYAVNPVALGSSISHYDSIASRNLLMEPAINADLTHNVKAPDDLTFELLQDVGWFPDADTDGVTDASDRCAASDTQPSVVIGACAPGVPNTTQPDGCTVMDPIRACAASAKNHGAFVSCVSKAMNDVKDTGVLSGAQKGAIQSCAAKAR